MITQSLGGSYTLLVPSYGGLFRLSNRDADAIGKDTRPAEAAVPQGQALAGEALENEVWQTLKTCFDPEIPVNIVDLGLVYDLRVSDAPTGGSAVAVKMTLTATGCGMGSTIELRIRVIPFSRIGPSVSDQSSAASLRCSSAQVRSRKSALTRAPRT